MDKVFIKELCIETVIGVYDWERKIKQAVCIDLELGTQISAASDSDNIEDAIDYKEVAKTVKSFIQKSEFLLEKGAIDMIVDRRNMRETVSKLINMLIN